MDVRRKQIRIPGDTVRKWAHEFASAVSSSASMLERKAFAGEIQLDGNRYVLKYEEGVNRVAFDYAGSELGLEESDSRDLAVIEWMIRIRKEAAKLGGAQPFVR